MEWKEKLLQVFSPEFCPWYIDRTPKISLIDTMPPNTRQTVSSLYAKAKLMLPDLTPKAAEAGVNLWLPFSPLRACSISFLYRWPDVNHSNNSDPAVIKKVNNNNTFDL